MNSFEHKHGVFRGVGYQGHYDGIDVYLKSDGKLHFVKSGVLICTHNLMRHGLALAKWQIKNEQTNSSLHKVQDR